MEKTQVHNVSKYVKPIKDANTRMNFFSRLAQMKKKEGLRCYSLSAEALHSHYVTLFDEAFEEEESKEE